MTRPSSELSSANAFLAEAKGRAKQDSKRRNLDLLWTALLDTRQEGRREYGIEQVGAKLAKLGGVRAQSIRNDSGADYRKLIELFADADLAHALDGSPLERSLSVISDESVRASVKANLAEAKRLRIENDRLRSLCGDLLLPLNPKVATEASGPAPGGLGLSPRLRDALEKGMSPERLSERGLRVGEDGSVYQGTVRLLPPGFASAIAHILAQGGAPSTEAKRLP